MQTANVFVHIYVCVSNMWHYSRLGSRQFTPSLSILHIKMTHITSHSLSFRSLFYGYFLIVFFLSFLQTKPNNVWSSSNRHRVSFAPKISNTQKECSFTMLVHLCKSIHYNQLHEYSKVVFNTFGTVSFICFSPLLYFFYCWMFFSNDFVHSIGTWKSIWNHLLFMLIYVAGCHHYLTCKKNIFHTFTKCIIPPHQLTVDSFCIALLYLVFW